MPMGSPMYFYHSIAKKNMGRDIKKSNLSKSTPMCGSIWTWLGRECECTLLYVAFCTFMQYRDRRTPEAGTMSYSYFEWLQWFFIMHNTIWIFHLRDFEQFVALYMAGENFDIIRINNKNPENQRFYSLENMSIKSTVTSIKLWYFEIPSLIHRNHISIIDLQSKCTLRLNSTVDPPLHIW